MKKSSFSLVLLICLIFGVSESYAKPNFRAIKVKLSFGCGAWTEVHHQQTGALIYKSRECTNIFGQHRTETVTPHQQ